MKKRMLRILLALTMALSLLPVSGLALMGPYTTTKYCWIWVGGIQVPDADGPITGETISGTVTYNKSTNTLTLINATITGDPEKGGRSAPICAVQDLNIKLVGDNTLIGPKKNFCNALSADGYDVTITGTGSLTAQTNNAQKHDIYGGGSTAIDVMGGKLTLNNCSVTVMANAPGMEYNIAICAGTMEINGCTVNATAGDSTTRSCALDAAELVITGSDVIATSGKSDSGNSRGIFSMDGNKSGSWLGDIRIADSNVVATGDNSAICGRLILDEVTQIVASTDKSGAGAVNYVNDDQDSYKYFRVAGVSNRAPVTETPAPETPTTIKSTGQDPDAKGMAYTSTQPVEVGGAKKTLEAYALKDPVSGNLTNYVKVRDVADALDGTAGQFNVGWDGAVDLVTGTAYTSRNGQENKTPYSGDRNYARFDGVTKVNGKPMELKAFVLTDDAGGASTYYKLRDLGQALGFNVGWSKDRGIFIEPGVAYSFDD